MRYSEKHEWVKSEEDLYIIGISVYAAEQLGDIVYIELPEIGKTVQLGDEVAVVESVKAASEVYTPLSGEIVEVNKELENNSALVNESAEEQGWFYKIKIENKKELESLMDTKSYQDYLKTQE